MASSASLLPSPRVLLGQGLLKNYPGAIDGNSPNALDQAGQAYQGAVGRLNQSQLDYTDLPTLFLAAAKQANPNYGLTRSDILAKYRDPKYADPNSADYIDPASAESFAANQAKGYQGVLGDAVSRATALYGRNVLANQQAVTDTSGTYNNALAAKQATDQNAFTSKQTADQQAFDAQQKALDRQTSLQQSLIAHNGSGGGVGNLTPAQLIANPRLALIKAGGNAVPDNKGGYNFFDANGAPITVQQAAALVPGASVAGLLKDSTAGQDQGLLSGKVSATQQASQSETDKALAALDSIDQLSGKALSNSKLSALTLGNLRGANQTGPTKGADSNALQYQNLVRQVPGLFLKALGVNRVSRQELENIQKSLPTLNITQGQASQDTKNLRDLFNRLSGQPAPANAPDSSAADYLKTLGL